MPKFLEQDLEAAAAKKGFSGRKADEYVYGTLNDVGAMHGNKETPKGAAMQARHNADEKAGKARPVAPMPKPLPTEMPAHKAHPGKNLGKFLHTPRKAR